MAIFSIPEIICQKHKFAVRAAGRGKPKLEMFETLAQLEQTFGTSLAFVGNAGEKVLSNSEIETYRVCSGDVKTKFDLNYEDYTRSGHYSKTYIDYAPYQWCTGFVFS